MYSVILIPVGMENGRYDVMLETKDKNKDAIIPEFKELNRRRESSLEETVAAALKQIEEKQSV